MHPLNSTHDPERRSWVEGATVADTDFPIQNLPFGRFQRERDRSPQGGVAIGDQIFDLAAAIEAGLFEGDALTAAQAAAGSDLRPLLAMGGRAVSPLRARLSEILRDDGPERGRAEALADRILVSQADVQMLLPTPVRQFSDMCVSTFHIGRRNGDDDRGQPICPAVFRTLPVGYDGRASSVIVSGTPVRRPNGVFTTELGGDDPHYGPEPRQDYELEMGVWFGGLGNAQGEPISIGDAPGALFGLCLLNDWSARGIQLWETMLGPFLGKSLATTVSPWIVTAEALAPFSVPAFPRPPGDPAVPAHLDDSEDQASGGYDIGLEAWLSSERMRRAHDEPIEICRTNFGHMYWTFAQMIAHHAGNGCGLAAGDLIGSGTCSGPDISEAACLIEKIVGGVVSLPGGETRTFLEDGDEVILRGRAEREGYVSIGFGEAVGRITPAPPLAR